MMSFTDNQIKEITGQILAIPQQILDLTKNKEELQKIKQDYKDLDDGNTVYTNFYYTIIEKYHEELKHLNGNNYPNPVTANIAYPSTTYYPSSPNWFPLIPYLQPADKGTATPSAYSPTEPGIIATTTTYTNMLVSGFNSSPTPNATDTTLTIGTVNTVDVNSPSSFAVGNKVLIHDTASSQYAYGTVTLKVGTELTISLILGTLNGMPVNSIIQNFHPGFTIPERESNTGLSGGELAYINQLKSLIDTNVALWSSSITSQKSAIDANPAGGSEATQNQTASTNIANLQTDINSWTGSLRFGTLLDTEIIANLSPRSSFVTTRTGQVTTALGSVSQAASPSGTFTGTGHHKRYCDNINARINMSSGTLSGYFNQDLAITGVNQQILLRQAELVTHTETFDVKEFTVDSTGASVLKLEDVAGLSNGQTVKIMSNTANVITTTIVDINDLEVQLAASIPPGYLVAEKARLVRQLQ